MFNQGIESFEEVEEQQQQPSSYSKKFLLKIAANRTRRPSDRASNQRLMLDTPKPFTSPLRHVAQPLLGVSPESVIADGYRDHRAYTFGHENEIRGGTSAGPWPPFSRIERPPGERVGPGRRRHNLEIGNGCRGAREEGECPLC